MRIKNACWGLPVKELPPQWREYQLVKLTGRLPSELDEESAHRLDWLLAIDAAVDEVKAELRKARR